MRALAGLCVLIATGFWSVAAWLEYHEPNHDAHAWAIVMLILGAIVALVLAVGSVLLEEDV